MATHCSLLAWIITWAKEPGMLYSPWGHKEADKTEATQHAGTGVQVKIASKEIISTTGRKSWHLEWEFAGKGSMGDWGLTPSGVQFQVCLW